MAAADEMDWDPYDAGAVQRTLKTDVEKDYELTGGDLSRSSMKNNREAVQYYCVRQHMNIKHVDPSLKADYEFMFNLMTAPTLEHPPALGRIMCERNIMAHVPIDDGFLAYACRQFEQIHFVGGPAWKNREREFINAVLGEIRDRSFFKRLGEDPRFPIGDHPLFGGSERSASAIAREEKEVREKEAALAVLQDPHLVTWLFSTPNRQASFHAECLWKYVSKDIQLDPGITMHILTSQLETTSIRNNTRHQTLKEFLEVFDAVPINSRLITAVKQAMIHSRDTKVGFLYAESIRRAIEKRQKAMGSEYAIDAGVASFLASWPSAGGGAPAPPRDTLNAAFSHTIV
jgi:hypothetical protein